VVYCAYMELNEIQPTILVLTPKTQLNQEPFSIFRDKPYGQTDGHDLPICIHFMHFVQELQNNKYMCDCIRDYKVLRKRGQRALQK
jgi:hypothetical protein